MTRGPVNAANPPLRRVRRAILGATKSRRVHDAIVPYHPWWDWGHRLMALVGREDGGSWGVPRPRDLWFYRDNSGRIHTTRHYADVRNNPGHEWRIFDSQNDGHEVIIGWWPRDHGNIRRSGLDGRGEIRLFRRWLLTEWGTAEWFGLRRWLYYKGLHAAVNQRKPFTCQATPPPMSGGYSHWHCQEPRRHEGLHRFHNYTWPVAGQVSYDPQQGTDDDRD